MVTFFPAALLRANTGLVFGEILLSDEELDFFAGEGELGVAEDDFFLITGEGVPGTLLPSGEANLELAFLLVMGLDFGDGPLVVVVVPMGDFLLLVFGEGEALLINFGLEELTPASVVLLNVLSIIPITLNSKDVCECPALSGGVTNFSDVLS